EQAGALAAIRVVADMDVTLEGTQQLDVVVLAHPVSAAFTEDVLLVAALGADVGAHVLDDAEDGDAHLLEHLETLTGVEERDVLGGRDDHGAGYRHALG